MCRKICIEYICVYIIAKILVNKTKTDTCNREKKICLLDMKMLLIKIDLKKIELLFHCVCFI